MSAHAPWHGAADVRVSGERVVAVVEHGESLPVGSAPVEVDAVGKLVLPGGVDPHCHVGFTSEEFTTLDGYPEAARAAIFGGTTMIVDVTLFHAPVRCLRRSRMASVHWQPTATVTARCMPVSSNTMTLCRASLRRSSPMASHGEGVTTYRGESMNADTLTRVIKKPGELGGMPYLHCEANHLVGDAQDDHAQQHQIGPDHHHDTRPALAERASVQELLAIAEGVRAPIYFVHQSTADVVDLVADARRRGVAAFGETVTHHLVLDNQVYAGPHPGLYVCCPPMRPHSSVTQLQQRVFSGEVSTVASDHCCYDTTQKRKYPDDVRAMPNGLPVVETRLPVFFSEFVTRRGLSLERFVQLRAANPARLIGIYSRKGTIAPGGDADLVLWDPQVKRTVRSADLHMATDYTPYEELEVTGWPVTTIVKGQLTVDCDTLVADHTRAVALPTNGPAPILTVSAKRRDCSTRRETNNESARPAPNRRRTCRTRREYPRHEPELRDCPHCVGDSGVMCSAHPPLQRDTRLRLVDRSDLGCRLLSGGKSVTTKYPCSGLGVHAA